MNSLTPGSSYGEAENVGVASGEKRHAEEEEASSRQHIHRDERKGGVQK